MVSYLLRRIAIAIVTILAISLISFLIIQLPPGDAVTARIADLAAQGDLVSEAQIESLREYHGLNKPVPVQYLIWMAKLLRGDLGVSFEFRRPVSELIGERLLMTVIVAGSAVLLTWALAIPIGIYSAVRQNSPGDYAFTFIGFIGLAVPHFLLALILLYLGFAWFDKDLSGLNSPEFVEAPWDLARVRDLLQHLWIPAIILGLGGTAQLIRILRANLLDELRKPYVVTVRAKGQTFWRSILRYPVRIALNPLISTIGYLLPYLVSGSVIVSVVLGLPTVGPLLLRALLAQDMYLAGAIVLILGALTVIGTLISDVLLVLLDPRIRLESDR
ncbi:MAG: ABC transporter permease [Phycisphaeraceae bacterium]|nr:ABC transporter permease [Phycisphaeraceae bacterium]